MFFKLDIVNHRVLFSLGERDLAIALAEMEGYAVVDYANKPRKAIAPDFHRNRHVEGVEPEQSSPGIYSYRIRPILRLVRSNPDGPIERKAR